DSLAFGAVARHVYGVIDDPENGRKLLVRAKNNVAAKSKNQTLAFRFGARVVGKDEETGEEIVAPHILWEPAYVDITAMEAMQAVADGSSPGKRDAAQKFLHDLLTGKQVSTTDVKEAAEANGLSWSTVWRAKDALGVLAEKDNSTPKGEWYWRLPTPVRREN